jgi:hypothetical protein
MKNFWSGFEKKAAEKEPSWLEGLKGSIRAVRWGDKGIKKHLNHPEVMKEVLKGGGKGTLIGGLAGGVPGAIAGLAHGRPGMGAAGGAVLGGLVGGNIGAIKARKAYLARKGIDSRWMGLSNKFTPEAKKKYIDDYKDKK